MYSARPLDKWYNTGGIKSASDKLDEVDALQRKLQETTSAAVNVVAAETAHPSGAEAIKTVPNRRQKRQRETEDERADKHGRGSDRGGRGGRGGRGSRSRNRNRDRDRSKRPRANDTDDV